MPVDFAASGASAMTITGHKVGRTDRESGALVLGRDVACTPLLHGGGQERDVRSGTLDVAGIASFAVAIEHSVKCQPEHAAALAALRDQLVARVLEVVPDAVLNGPRPMARCGGCPATRTSPSPAARATRCCCCWMPPGVACSTGSACSAGIAQPSHVLVAMGADDACAKSSLRFSLGHTSTAADIDELVAALPGAVERARRAYRPRS